VGEGVRPIRRIVTGHDGRGKSCVLYAGDAPSVTTQPNKPGSGMTDLWVFPSCPVDLSGERDDGNIPFRFEPPHHGGHLRIVQSAARPPDYDPEKDLAAVPPHPPKPGPGGTEYRGGANLFRSPTHRSKTVDYGIVLQGERTLELDDTEVVLKTGDTIVQLGNWHAWNNACSESLMAFFMMGGTFDGPPVKPFQPVEVEGGKMTNSVRRIVTADDENGKPKILFDGPAPDVTTDPSRPGYVSTRIWVTDRTPARMGGYRETILIPRTIEPPPGGSVFRVATFPPESSYMDRVGREEVHRFFESSGSPGASAYTENGPHPYLQKTTTLDFCMVLEGEITLVLETQEVTLGQGDVVIQRGTSHAWSNRSDKPCTIVFSQHDGKF
jgi:quercetin dioxygenase-like cupin family protein